MSVSNSMKGAVAPDNAKCPLCGGRVWVEEGNDYYVDTYYDCEDCSMGAHQYAGEGEPLRSDEVEEFEAFAKWAETLNVKAGQSIKTAWFPVEWIHSDRASMKAITITPEVVDGRLVWTRRDEPDRESFTYQTFREAKTPSHPEHEALIRTSHRHLKVKLLNLK